MGGRENARICKEVLGMCRKVRGMCGKVLGVCVEVENMCIGLLGISAWVSIGCRAARNKWEVLGICEVCIRVGRCLEYMQG